MSAEEKKTPEQPDEPVLSDKRKAAVLRYMAVLFAVAFILVAASLVLQMHNSQTTISQLNAASTSALSNAEELQQQNRDLQDERKELQSRLDELESKLSAQEKELGDLKKENEVLQAQTDELYKTASKAAGVYTDLIIAMSCTTHEGNITFSKAMSNVEKNQALLSQEALAAYERLLSQEEE